MSQKETKPRKKGISLVNWLGTLLLSALPGINVIAWVLFCIFGKNRSKRTFAAAALILTGAFAVLFCLAFFFVTNGAVN